MAECGSRGTIAAAHGHGVRNSDALDWSGRRSRDVWGRRGLHIVGAEKRSWSEGSKRGGGDPNSGLPSYLSRLDCDRHSVAV